MWRRCSSLLPPLLACFALACGTLSVDQERELSDEFERDVRRNVVMLRDSLVRDYVDRIGRDILEAAGPQPFEYTFDVIEDPEINAFAGPAGHIFIHTGVIQKAENVSELAGVVAHEIGHVVRRHVAENYNRSRSVGIGQKAAVIAADVLFGSHAGGATNLLGGMAAASYLNTFGREAEREADAFAVDVMVRAGYDPNGLVSFFETLRQEGGPRPPAFLSSHPTTESRIADTSALIRAKGRLTGLRKEDGGRFEIIQRRVDLRTGTAAPSSSESGSAAPEAVH